MTLNKLYRFWFVFSFFLSCQHSSFLPEDLSLHWSEGDALGIDGHVADRLERFDSESSNRDQLDTGDAQMSGVLKQIL
jgi:hypothetical protein